jgi:hypothetical protein
MLVKTIVQKQKQFPIQKPYVSRIFIVKFFNALILERMKQ